MVSIPHSTADVATLPAVQLGGHNYHLEEVLSDRRPRVISMRGWPFAQAFVFHEHAARIRHEYLRLDPGCLQWDMALPGPEDVVVHIRAYHDCATCIKKRCRHRPHTHGQFVDMPFEYYAGILEVMSRARPLGVVWLLSRCGADEPVAARLLQRFPTARLLVPPEGSAMVAKHPHLHGFLFAAAARRLVLSQSTFSWWAAYVGRAAEVHYPLAGEWWYSGNTPQRHRLYPNESRYVYHNLCSPAERFLSYAELEPLILRLDAGALGECPTLANLSHFGRGGALPTATIRRGRFAAL